MASPGDLLQAFPTVDGEVTGAVERDGILYLAGSFNMIGRAAGGWGSVDLAGGNISEGLPAVDGPIYAMVPDGSEGWFVGGTFSQVGGLARNNLARILADGTVDPDWNADADDVVWALAISPDRSTLYVGGSFGTIGAAARNRIAAVDVGTGTVTAWDPSANHHVYALAVASDGTVYAGGYFDTIGGQERIRIAALDPATGDATTWNPVGNTGPEYVRAIALSEDESIVYIGGRIQMVGGQVRQRIAAISAADGSVTAWNPMTGGNDPVIYSIAVSGQTVYAAGSFTQIGSQPRNNLAALDATTGLATAWDPNLGGTVYSIAIHEGVVYAGGDFMNVGGQTQWSLASIDAATGELTTAAPSADSTVRTLAVADGHLYLGGGFSILGEMRSNLAAVDTTTGQITSWNPASDGGINDVDLSEDGATLYIGGAFETVAGQTRYNLAALDLASGAATDWDPSIIGGFGPPVYSLAVDSGVVYVGGDFTDVGSEAVLNLAAIDATTGLATAWLPSPDGAVLDLEVSEGNLYVAGYFTSIAGTARTGAAAFSLQDGALLAWDPQADNSVVDLSIDGENVYLAGAFSAVGGEARAQLAAVDIQTAAVKEWAPSVSGDVSHVLADAGAIYAGGNFNQVGADARTGLALVNPLTGGACSAFDASLDEQVTSVLRVGDWLLVSGYFSHAGGAFRPNLAVFEVYRGPTASGAEFAVRPGQSYAGTLQAAEGSEFTIVDQPLHGSVTITDAQTGAYTYEADADASGTDSFSYRINDGCLASDPTTVAVTFLAPNQAPTATGGSLVVHAGQTQSGSLLASDADDDALTFALVSNGTKGTVVITDAQTGTYTYTAQADAQGTDTFTFLATDGSAESNTAAVVVTIVPQNSPEPEPGTYTLTTAVEPENAGTITRNPNSDSYAEGATVTVVAHPAAGYRFVKWQGSASGMSATNTVTMSESKVVQAVFVAEQTSSVAVVTTEGPSSIALSDSGNTQSVAGLNFSSATQPGNVVMNLNASGEAHNGVFSGFVGGAGLSRSVSIHSDLAAGSFVALLELYYSVDELGELDETQLRLFRWNDAEQQWKLAATVDKGVSAPTAEVGDHGVDVVNHRVWAVVDRFSEFGIGVGASEATAPDGDDDASNDDPAVDDQDDAPDDDLVDDVPDDDSVEEDDASTDDTIEQEEDNPADDALEEDSLQQPEVLLPACGACGAGVPLMSSLGLIGLALLRRQG